MLESNHVLCIFIRFSYVAISKCELEIAFKNTNNEVE